MSGSGLKTLAAREKLQLNDAVTNIIQIYKLLITKRFVQWSLLFNYIEPNLIKWFFVNDLKSVKRITSSLCIFIRFIIENLAKLVLLYTWQNIYSVLSKRKWKYLGVDFRIDMKAAISWIFLYFYVWFVNFSTYIRYILKTKLTVQWFLGTREES